MYVYRILCLIMNMYFGKIDCEYEVNIFLCFWIGSVFRVLFLEEEKNCMVKKILFFL